MNCEFCSSPVHVWFQCPKKPDGWKPARLAKENRSARVGPTAAIKPDASGSFDVASGSSNHLAPELKSTAVLKETQRELGVALGGPTEKHAELSRYQYLPVDTNPAPDQNPLDVVTSLAGVDGDKDRPKFNKNEYQKAYMREVYRPRLKAKKEAVK